MLDRLKHLLRLAAEWPESAWFDLRHNVRTRDYMRLGDAGVTQQQRGDSEMYAPGRAANIRECVRAAGIQDVRPYAFVDLGSGKGRALFVAGQMPFAECVGVEFSEVLHHQASVNLETYRGRAAAPIRLVHANAMHFEFPPLPLVIYLFNPFGTETMRAVLHNLQESLRENRRHVVMVLLWPQVGPLMRQWSGARLKAASRRYEIYEWGRPAELALP